ncbi:Scr1 family TA system antitoxin-like transcriptional regulator, partial [Nocardia cyriacigeorgica]|uniref:Scr1 family TA system antitoxin-like transcriptional regulator n=1 Tax=Nocardia cyriacigeorgica TaxID=135487 RepID=UPI001E398450
LPHEHFWFPGHRHHLHQQHHRRQAHDQTDTRITSATYLDEALGQAVLMQQVGGPDVQRAQLRHLIDLADRYADNLDLRVVPFDAQGSAASLNVSTLHLMDFDSVRLPTLGWLESAIHFEVIEDRPRIETLEYQFKQVVGIALDQDASLRLIDRIATRIK